MAWLICSTVFLLTCSWSLDICLGQTQGPNIPTVIDDLVSSEALPEITRRPQNTLELIAVYDTPPAYPQTYQWLKDDQPISGSTDTYFFLSIAVGDTGTYRVRVSNAFGSVLSRGVVLMVQEVRAEADPNAVVTRVGPPGLPVLIPLEGLVAVPPVNETRAVHPVKVTWCVTADTSSAECGANMAAVTNSPNEYYQTAAQDLYVLNTPATLSGQVYQATAEIRRLPKATLSKYQIQLSGTVQTSRSIEFVYTSPSQMFVALDGDAYVECLAHAIPLGITYAWRKDGAVLSGEIGPNVRVTPSVPGVENYTCEATSPAGDIVTKDIRLVVVAPLVFSAATRQQTLSGDVESPIELECAPSVQAGEVIVRERVWYFNGVPVTPGGRLSVSPVTGTLRVTSLWLNDTGVYQCVVSNEAAEDSLVVSLTVTSSPPVVISSSFARGVVGSDLLVPCAVSGKPTPTVTWTRNGVVVDLSSQQFRQTADGLVLVAPTSWEVSGRFVCTAVNFLGTDAGTIEAFVYNATRIDLTRPTRLLFPKSLRNTIVCPVVKDSRLVDESYTWYKDGSGPLVSGGTVRLVGPNLEFTSVGPSDGGSYECVVTSVAGNGTRDFTVIVTDLPGTAGPVDAVMGSRPRSIDVSWPNAYDGNLAIEQYDLRVYESGSLRGNTVTVVPVTGASRQSVLITFEDHRIRPSRSYAFEARAVNALGPGRYGTRSNEVLLPPEAPDAAPTNLRVAAESNTVIRVTFDRPPTETINGPLTGYSVRYSRYSNILQHRNFTNGNNVVELSLDGLAAYSDYTVAVATANAQGLSEYSETRTVSTLEGPPSSAPTGVTAEGVSSTSVQLSWVTPTGNVNGQRKGYNIRYRPEPSIPGSLPGQLDVNYTGPSQSFVVPSLLKYTNYTFDVALFTNGGTGPYASARARTDEDAPGIVGNLRATDVAFNYATVTWNPPTQPNGVILGYVVQHEATGTAASAPEEAAVEPGETSLTVSGLVPETVYEIRVLAYTSKGRGLPQSTTARTTSTPVEPGRPGVLGAAAVNATAAQLSFTPPGSSGGSPVTDWIVEAVVGDDSSVPVDTPEAVWTEIYRQDPATVGTDASGDRYLTVTGLSPYTWYILRLRAANLIGSGPPSPSTSPFLTDADVPTGTPRDVTLRAHNSTCLVARWTPLAAGVWNGKPVGYTVYVSELGSGAGGGNALPRLAPGELTRALLVGGLRPYTNYSVFVVANNSEYGSAVSESVSSTTIESVPSTSPAIGLITATATALRVPWTGLTDSELNGVLLAYQISVANPSGQVRVVDVNDTSVSALKLASLQAFTSYDIKIRARTRIGPGPWSPTVRARTGESTQPGLVGNLHVMRLTGSGVQFGWKPPTTGAVARYEVAFAGTTLNVTETTVTFSRLVAGQEYQVGVAAVSASPSALHGPAAVLVIVASNSPELPAAATDVFVSNLAPADLGGTSASVSVRWRHRVAGILPVRNYTVLLTPAAGGEPVTAYLGALRGTGLMSLEIVAGGLRPNTGYDAQVWATNDRGRGGDSQPSIAFRSAEARPSGAPPRPPTATPLTSTRVDLAWEEPPSATWNGNLTGFRVFYDRYEPSLRLDWTSFPSVVVPAGTLNLSLTLAQGHLFEIRVAAVNAAGQGPSSTPVILYVGVAVPAASPRGLAAADSLPTGVVLTWTPLVESESNGGLLGYKVTYYESAITDGRSKRAAGSLSRDTRAVGSDVVLRDRIVAPEADSFHLDDLTPYTSYTVRVLAFNLAGEGPYSDPLVIKTGPVAPGPPAALQVFLLTRGLANVSWTPPQVITGLITDYRVIYRPTLDPVTVATTSGSVVVSNGATSGEPAGPTLPPAVDVVVSTTHTQIRVDGSQVGALYAVSVQARVLDVEQWGDFSNTTVDVRPEGVPDVPLSATYVEEDGGIVFTLEWSQDAAPATPANGTGSLTVLGVAIEGELRGAGQWDLITRVDVDASAGTSASVRVPSAKLGGRDFRAYRVSLYNGAGPGHPKEAEKTDAPFYQQWWFLVIVALCFVMVIVIVVAVLCCECFHRRNKAMKDGSGSSGHDNGGMSPPGEFDADLATTYPHYEMSSTPGAGGRGTRRQGPSGLPRPSPMNVQYGGEEGPPVYGDYDDDDDMSSVGKGHRGAAGGGSSDDEDVKKVGLETDNESHEPSYSNYNNYQYGNQYSNHSAVSAGPYVGNADVQESWQSTLTRSHRRPPNVFNYTDSESEAPASHRHSRQTPARAGGLSEVDGRRATPLADQQAGSRTPLPGLPGFSSFV